MTHLSHFRYSELNLNRLVYMELNSAAGILVRLGRDLDTGLYNLRESPSDLVNLSFRSRR